MTDRLVIKSEIDNLRIVENAIDRITNQFGIDQENYGKIMVATLEAVNNAITHGNKADPAKNVSVEFFIEKNILKVEIKDEGRGFKPSSVPDPTLPGNIEAINGRGIFLMKKLADGIEYNKSGNAVLLTFKI